jgi:pilus assembly protein CpaE
MTTERDRSQVLLLFTPTVGDVTELLASARQSRPDMGLVVAMPGPANGFIEEAFKAGAHEIVILPAEAAVVAAAAHKAMARVATAGEAEAPTQRASLVVVLGPKGGVGKTTVSTSLATELARRSHETLIVDLDLQFGDVGLALGVEPERTIFDMAQASEKLDGERLRGYLGRSVDGVHTLLAPIRPDQAEAIEPAALQRILAVAGGEFDAIVVDTPPAFGASTITAIDHARHAVMVGTLDLAGLKNMKLGLETLDLMGFPADRVTTVLNRADTKVGLLAGDVRAVIGRGIDVELPSSRVVPRAANSSRPIVSADPKSAPARQLRALADRLERRLALGEES